MRIKDVARRAGVSTATVSHVINNTRFVSDATRLKVLDAIEECKYYPNAHARSLASGRSQMIGVLVSDIANPFFPELVKSIEAAAFERGYDVLLLNTDYQAERTLHYVRRIIQRKVAGVALMTSELDAVLIDELARCRISVVFLDLGSKGTCMSNVVVDYEVGIEEAVRHLVERGHRRFAYVGGPLRLRSAVKRLDAFRDSVQRLLPEGPPPVIHEGDFRFDGGVRAAREFLAAPELPTAVVAANDMMALGVMRECVAYGLSIPQDISIVGFDDIAFAELADPPLTTVSLPRTELGRKAVEALMMTIDHPEREGVEVHIATHLVERSSTDFVRASERWRRLS
ncbi:MAG TPA: LacI family DNA-binding transcriptional regulator [Pyrinomonadaceae bacterium]|jgi:LacI family transcriptional regulator|nr:LacI family DNA-binding transcriptional regulator [Pyrinomonadaceae bacterium]